MFFFDLLKTTLKKHDIQSGQSFEDGGSIFLLTKASYAMPSFGYPTTNTIEVGFLFTC